MYLKHYIRMYFMPTTALCISIDEKTKLFLEEHPLIKPSAVFRKAIYDLIDNDGINLTLHQVLRAKKQSDDEKLRYLEVLQRHGINPNE